MDPTLTIALILAIGWALSYRAKWKRAEREAARLNRETCHYRAHACESERKYLAAHFKWLDMKSRYLDSLDEIAALRDGAAE
ncbi:MAG TPA: hypothetical protein VGK73_33090 [Polyangiaceae bacterium]